MADDSAPGAVARRPGLPGPAGRRFQGHDRRAPLREALAAHARMSPGQTAGRFYPVACVALEITQRCNLDCTLCYLSERAEAAHDVPMALLLSRLDTIADHYGPGTSVQITGGDPTLRPVADLETLCRAIRARGMRACLMTNGIRAMRDLLGRLAAAGLDDVAFHVDLTEERRGYPSEVSLNAVRDAYIARARGLGLRILFNTTVFAGNLAEVPALARYFRDRAAEVTLASFQMQADTGRGTIRDRPEGVTRKAVLAGLEKGFGSDLAFDAVDVGHPDCNRYAALLVAGNRTVPALGDAGLVHRMLAALAAAEPEGARAGGHLPIRATLRRLLVRRPGLALRALGHGLGLLARLAPGLAASRGRVHRLSVLVHAFMDAGALEADRCATCVFKVATEDGPLSMCVHNAARDAYLFQPSRLDTADGPRWWSAATGRTTRTPEDASPPTPGAKRLKGRARQTARAGRPAGARRP